MELNGSPLERLQVSAGYTYTTTETLSPVRSVNVAVSDGTTYNTLIPRHSSSGTPSNWNGASILKPRE